jgi:hypothetical protein
MKAGALDYLVKDRLDAEVLRRAIGSAARQFRLIVARPVSVARRSPFFESLQPLLSQTGGEGLNTVTRLKSTSPRPGSFGDLLDEFDDGPPNVALLDPPECLRETQRIRRIEEIDDVASAFPIAGRAESAAKKEQDGHVQDFGNLLQPSDLNAVVSGLIFFHLLERHAERKTQ